MRAKHRKLISQLRSDLNSMFYEQQWLSGKHDDRHEADGERLTGIEASIAQINSRLFELEKIYGLRHVGLGE